MIWTTRTLLLVLLVCGASATPLAFDVKPHQPLTIAKELVHGKSRFICEFGCKATGGSLEAWAIDVLVSGSESNLNVQCVVSRPNPPSYLVFNEFAVTLKGPSKLEIVSASVSDNDGALGEGTAWVLHKRKLRSKDGWSGLANKLTVESRLRD